MSSLSQGPEWRKPDRPRAARWKCASLWRRMRRQSQVPSRQSVLRAPRKPDETKPKESKEVAEKLVDDASKVLAREAEATAEPTATDKSKAHDAA
jgi:N6-adenosine-specific RNA methylase IME4